MIKANKTFYQLLSVAIVVLAIAIPLLVGHFNGKEYDRSIRRNSSITLGTIYDYEQVYKHSAVLKYEFEFNGVKYFSSSSNSQSGLRWEESYKKLFPKIKGKSFPVFLSKDEPSRYNKILITPEDFSEFDIAYPDSLYWIKAILKY